MKSCFGIHKTLNLFCRDRRRFEDDRHDDRRDDSGPDRRDDRGPDRRNDHPDERGGGSGWRSAPRADDRGFDRMDNRRLILILFLKDKSM